jgi:adenylate kinase
MICVLVGPPGSGKGTQAELLAGALRVPHVSTGDLLRAETEAGTALGRQVASTLAAGELVPDEVIGRVLGRRLRDSDAAGGVLLDGYPRTVPQARTLDGLLEAAGRRVDVVLALGVDERTLVGRLQRRAVEQHRTDDNPESIAERLREYRQLTEPVIDYYRGRSTPVLEVDGTGEVGEVQRRVREALASVANPPAW